MRHLTTVTFAGLFALSGGCVSRQLSIDSTPQGASAYVNGILVGTTPASTRFRHYGDYTIEVALEGWQTARAVEPIRAPWYCRFPVGLFSELLLPVRIRDERFVHYELREHALPEKSELLGDAARKAD